MKVILFFLIINITYSFEIRITQIKDMDKPIYLLVFDKPEGFPYDKTKSVFSDIVTPISPTTIIDTNLKSGEYSIVVYQDINENEKLDRWFFGKPKEPFGINNTLIKPIKAPTFKMYKEDINEDETIEVKLWQ